MQNALPANGPRNHESAIINLDDKDGPRTYWVAYRKRGDNVVYFDSFGDLQPPIDLRLYVQENEVLNCGHLCFKFLRNSLPSVWVTMYTSCGLSKFFLSRCVIYY